MEGFLLFSEDMVETMAGCSSTGKMYRVERKIDFDLEFQSEKNVFFFALYSINHEGETFQGTIGRKNGRKVSSFKAANACVLTATL